MDIDTYNNVKGTYIELTKITYEDAELIFSWRSSQSGLYLNRVEGYSLDMQKNWIQTRPTNEINYIIKDATTKLKVGMIGIVGISNQDKNAEVGRLLLAPEYLNVSNPYGLEALKICYDLVINKWNFKKVYGNILSTNKNMIRLQKYLGMIEEGVLKQQRFIDGRYQDLILVAIFKEQLNESYIPKINLLLKSFER